VSGPRGSTLVFAAPARGAIDMAMIKLPPHADGDGDGAASVDECRGGSDDAGKAPADVERTAPPDVRPPLQDRLRARTPVSRVNLNAL
jgi:hypothetical protein